MRGRCSAGSMCPKVWCPEIGYDGRQGRSLANTSGVPIAAIGALAGPVLRTQNYSIVHSLLASIRMPLGSTMS